MMRFLLVIALVCGVAGAAVADEVVFAVVVNRHGDRAPFDAYPNLKYSWGVPPAELTAIGMGQTYALGTRLRERYVYNERLLAARYQPGAIAAVASNTNRTIMSAQCILAGLYPPGTGPVLASGHDALPGRMQVIPFRTVPEGNWLLLTPYDTYQAILARHVYRTPEWLAREAALRPRFKAWGRAVGEELSSLKDVLSVGDVLHCATSHGFRGPAGLSGADVREILDATAWGLAQQFKTEAVSWLMGGALLSSIRGHFDDFRNKKKSHRLALYSGHDITLLPLLALLGSPRDRAVGYASHVALELLRSRRGELSLRVLQNGELVREMRYDAFTALVDAAAARNRGLTVPAVK